MAGFPANLLVYPVIKLDLQMHGVLFCMNYTGRSLSSSPGSVFDVKNYLGMIQVVLWSTLGLLDKEGYRVYYNVLNASRFGVPQKRERIYFVCLRKDLNGANFNFPNQPMSVLLLRNYPSIG